MQFPAEVEKWRPLVAKYFPANLVDKALYVIQYESGGDPNRPGDGGAARGLFQIQDSRNFSNRPDAAYLDNPENNIRYAAQELGAAGGNWGAWGEGTSYQGQKFGALGNHPFPGDQLRTTGDLNVAGEGAQPSGTVHSLQELNAEIERARTAALEARKRAAADPDAIASGTAELANEASAYYIELESLRLELEAADANRANDAFSAGIQLGDFQGRQADRAFGQYMDKRDAARTAAQAQIDSAKDRNLINADVEKARYENFGQGPQAETRTYIPPTFEDALARWEKEYGVGEQPSGNPADYGGPALPGSGGGGQPLIPTQTGGVSHYEGQRVIFSDDQYGMNPTTVDNQGSTVGANVPPTDQEMYRPPVSKGIGKQPIQDAGGWESPKAWPKAGGDQWKSPAGADRRTGRNSRWWLDWEGQQQPNRYADGTTAASPGKAYVGEKGPEVMIGPDGRPRVIGQWGPEVMDMQGGEQIIPNGVPPDEAFAYSQIQNALKQGAGASRGQSMGEQQARAMDPQLQEKVLAALQQAVVAQTVAQPPLTPTLNGQWTKPDPWSDWRGLTGVPPVPMEAAV